jgi:hypothetical protein
MFMVAAERDRKRRAILGDDRPARPAPEAHIIVQPGSALARIGLGRGRIADMLDREPGLAERKAGEKGAAGPLRQGGVEQDRQVDPVRGGEVADTERGMAPGQIERGLVRPGSGVDRSGAGDRLAAVEQKAGVAHGDDPALGPAPLGRQRLRQSGVDLFRRQGAAAQLHPPAPPRHGDVEAVPAGRQQGLDEGSLFLVERGVEDEQRSAAAELRPFAHQQCRHFGAKARHGERGDAGGEAAARDQQSVILRARHRARLAGRTRQGQGPRRARPDMALFPRLS